MSSVLWKIWRYGIKPSYLFGTLHFLDKRMMQLNPIVEQAMARCSKVVMEANFASLMADIMKLVGRVQLENGRRLRDIVNQENYRKIVVSMSRRGIEEYATDKLKPWACLLILFQDIFAGCIVQMPQIGTPLILDQLIYQKAQALGMHVEQLETVDDTLEIFESIGTGNALEILSKYDEADDTGLKDKIIDAYIANNYHAVERIGLLARNWDSRKAYQRLMWSICEGRTEKWLPPLLEHLNDGDVFVAVGFFHLVGPQGLIALLKEHGYSLSPVALTTQS